MEKMMRRFLWAGSQELHGGKCKVAWTKVARPVKIGRLGVRNLELFARALRLRWLWYEWTAPDKPWIGMELPVDHSDRALFAAATRVQVNNGENASFWNSSWLSGTPPAMIFPLLYKHNRRKNRTVREAIIDDQWIRDLAHNLSEDILRDYFSLWEFIEAADLDLT